MELVVFTDAKAKHDRPEPSVHGFKSIAKRGVSGVGMASALQSSLRAPFR